MQETRAHRPPRLLWLFNLLFLYLAYQRWWSISRLWPHMPLCSALCACGVGVGWQSLTIQLLPLTLIVTSSAWRRLFLCSNLLTLAQSAKGFPNHFHSCGRKTVKVLTGGEKSIWGWAQDKVTCSNRYVFSARSLNRSKQSLLHPITVSGKEWIIAWHLNFAQLTFTTLCTEQMQLECLKIPALFKPFWRPWNEKYQQ